MLASKRGSATTGVPSLNISIWTSAQSPIRSQRQSQALGGGFIGLNTKSKITDNILRVGLNYNFN